MSSAKEQIIKALQKAAREKEVNLEFPEREEFGDYSSNIAMQLAKKGKRGNFLENIEWIVKNVKKTNWKEKKFDLAVGRLAKEVVRIIGAKSDMVYLNGYIFARINGWLDYRGGHQEVLSILPYLPYICAYPLDVYSDKNDEKRSLLSFKIGRHGVVLIEVFEERNKNEIVTIFFINPRRLKKGLLGKCRIPSLQAPAVKRGAGASLSSLQESHLFYNKLAKESQGAFSLEYEIKKNPREIAEEIVDRINARPGLPAEASAKAGFINFWLSPETLLGNLEKIGADYGSSEIGKGKTVVVDYSSPNIAKEFSIGHLRSTIIGQALYNLYQFLGYKVIGDNHLGDWGTQFGKLLYMIDKCQPPKLTIEELEKLYVEFHKLAEKDKSLEDEARKWFKRLEDGDKTARKIWQKCVDVSLKEFARIYRLLDVKIDYAYGESFYQKIMPQVFQDAARAKLAKKSQGALIIEIPGLKAPLMLSKSDEATTYATRDLATIKFRMEKWHPAIIIYEVGEEQSLHFKQVFAAARMLGYVGKDVELVHTKHGLYLGPGGQKFSTRRGETVKLEKVLLEAISRAKKLGNSDEETARAVGIGAVKYFDLVHHPTSNISFDWEKMFLMEGNSGPYLQYTVARTNSVLAKLKTQNLNLKTISKACCFAVTQISKLNAEELKILRCLVRFPEVIETSAKTYSPNLICNYLYDLASKFNGFYNKHRIIGSESEKFRLALTTATGQVLKTGLGLLGIQAPERM